MVNHLRMLCKDERRLSRSYHTPAAIVASPTLAWHLLWQNHLTTLRFTDALLQSKLCVNADDGTIINRVYILHPSSSPQSSPSCFLPYNPSRLSLSLSLSLSFSAAALSFCWGRSQPWTIRSASRWNCEWAPGSPRCRHCALQLPVEAEGRIERKGRHFYFICFPLTALEKPPPPCNDLLPFLERRSSVLWWKSCHQGGSCHNLTGC